VWLALGRSMFPNRTSFHTANDQAFGPPQGQLRGPSALFLHIFTAFI
jgi:hypothetical protein